ncbi:MAG: hypothetical protein KatS3mg026_0133 [Bacteroidia bacterium]|nr:MAG: hypothetical protein KatS3mg026_0133 [Bacteroidia bacterium]
MSGAPEYQLVGLLHALLPVVPLGRDRKKQPFVVLTDTPRPQYILLEAHGPLVERVQKVPLHAKVAVRFALEGWLWHPPQGAARYVVRLLALEITRLEENMPTGS